MASSSFETYIETGKKRVFATALDWPGWCRGARDEGSALATLLTYAPRYARVASRARLGFHAPKALDDLQVVERVEGTADTDMCCPVITLARDTQPMSDAEVERLSKVLKACWRAFDAALVAAEGFELTKGPRGGGRDQQAMAQHVYEGEVMYLSRLGVKLDRTLTGNPIRDPAPLREAVLKGVVASAHGELPKQGPRGGRIWCARYFFRRAAWHILDHVWEIEDRMPRRT